MRILVIYILLFLGGYFLLKAVVFRFISQQNIDPWTQDGVTAMIKELLKLL